MAILDQFGKPIPERALAREPAELATDNQLRLWAHSTVASFITPERLAAVLRDNDFGYSLELLHLAIEMEERDLHYFSQLQVRTHAIAGAPVRVEPGDESAEATDAAEQFDQYVVQTPEFHFLLSDLQDAVSKGYSVIQPIWDTTTKPWTFVEFHHHDPRCFTFDYPQLTNIRHRLPDNRLGGEPLPPGFFLIHYPRIRAGVRLRGGIVRLAAVNWLFKTHTVKDWLAFAEVYGMPIRIGRYDPQTVTSDEKAALRNALVNLGHDAAAMIPKSMELTIEDARRPTSGDNLFQGLADYFDEQLSKAVNGITTASDAKSKGIGTGEGSTHQDTRLEIKRADAIAVQGTLRMLARVWTQFNFKEGTPPPRICIDVDPPEDETEAATTFQRVAQACAQFKAAGLKVSPEMIEEQFGFEIEEDPNADAALQPGAGASDGSGGDSGDAAPDEGGYGANASVIQAAPNFIRKVGSSYHVMSESGKSLGKYRTRAAAAKRLRQIEYFKHAGNAALPKPLEFAEDQAGGLLANWQQLLAPHKAALERAADASGDYAELEAKLKGLADNINSDPLVRALATAAMKARGVASGS